MCEHNSCKSIWIIKGRKADMIIDAHYHLEERMETLDELLAQMTQHGIDRVALIPTLVDPIHLSRIAEIAAMMLPRLLMSIGRRIGFLLYNSTVTKDGKFSALGKMHLIYDSPDNASVAKVLNLHPERFYGWICVNPRVSEPITEVERWVGKPGWIGVKTHPFWHRYSIDLLDDVAAYCVERDWPLLLHLGSDIERGDYRYLPDRHPKLKLIYAHAGLPFYREVWEYGKSKDNVYIDLSNPFYVDEQVRVNAVKSMGPEKCVHGTDGPYANANQGRMLNYILRLPLSDLEKERILGKNFINLIS
jgi:predicted TIM-barrel fold metal-dependent hydrolase